MSEIRNENSVTEQGNPRKPQGEAGFEMLERMNESHYNVTGWALGFFDFRENDRVLDIGCGGGETLKRMAEHIKSGHLTGADYSPVSVELSRRKNPESINSGKMDIIEASVENLPFDDNRFDKIITVESFYFWNNPQEDLKEVYRVLDKDGTFLIVADIFGGAELSESDLKNIEKYRLFNPTPEQFRELLTNVGFRDITIHTKENTSWICAEGKK